MFCCPFETRRLRNKVRCGGVKGGMLTRPPYSHAFLIAVILIACSQGYGQNASQLIHKLQQAIGGAEKIAAIRDFDELSEADTVDPRGAPIRVQKRVRWLKPNYLRIDQLGPFDTYVLYFDGDSGWEIPPDGKTTVLTGGELQFAKKYLEGLLINLWLADRLPGYAITSTASNVIRFSIHGDFTDELTLDPTTSLPVKHAYISLGNPDRPTPIEHQIYEWTTVEGVRFPAQLAIVQNGRKLGELKTQSIKINTGISSQDLASRPVDRKPVLSAR